MIEFFQIVPGGIPPQRADRSALGTLPARALRYCEAVQAAAGMGFYLYPPVAFSLMLDGSCALFSFEGTEDWFALHGAVQYPEFAGSFDASAPAEIRGYSPPWLTLTETGLVQVWCGCLVRTPKDWSLWIKAPTNLPASQGIECLEGVVETDWWFGPLFSNFRLLRSGLPFHFPRHRPLFQVVAFPRAAYEVAFRVRDLAALSGPEWAAYCDTIVRPMQQDNRQLGGYAVTARKRRAAQHQKE